MTECRVSVVSGLKGAWKGHDVDAREEDGGEGKGADVDRVISHRWHQLRASLLAGESPLQCGEQYPALRLGPAVWGNIV